MFHPGPRSTSSQQQQQQQGTALTLLLLLVSLLRIARFPFRRRATAAHGAAAAAVTMSSKSILPSYQDQVVSSAVGGRHGRCRDHHSEKAHYHHHHNAHSVSPSRRKKSRWCYCYCLPRLRHVLVFLATLLFIFYVTGCLHLYKRISLKKDHDSMHLQTTTWNFRFSRGPIDVSLGTFRTSRDMVEINYHPEAQASPS
ncbi:hypothetical protein RB594_006011 [Gaeumannomyces avenae]